MQRSNATFYTVGLEQGIDPKFATEWPLPRNPSPGTALPHGALKRRSPQVHDHIGVAGPGRRTSGRWE